MRVFIIIFHFTLLFTSLSGQYEECGIINGDSDFIISNSLLSGDGNTLAVTMYRTDGTDFSKVQIYEVRENGIISKGSIESLEPLLDRYLGLSICMSHDGNRIGVTGIYGVEKSFLKIFDYVNEEWIQVGKTIYSDLPQWTFGSGISMSKDGNIIAAGTWNLIVGIFYRSGYVDIYEFNSNANNWEQKGKRIEGDIAYTNFGESVDLSDDGDRLIIGSSSTISTLTVGFVKIYDFKNEEWVLYDNIPNENNENFFGFTCALNGEGNFATTSVQKDDGTLSLLFVNLNTMAIGEIWNYQFPHRRVDWSTNDNLKISDNGKIISFGVYGRDTSIFDNGNIGKIGVYQQDDNGDWTELSGIEKPLDQTVSVGESFSMSNNGSKVAVLYGHRNGGDSSRDYVKLYFNKEITTTNNLNDSELKDIYPNPTKDIINLPIIEEKYKMIEIWDSTGKLMYSSSTITSSLFDVSHFNSGIYYLHLQTKNGAIQIQRFVKE